MNKFRFIILVVVSLMLVLGFSGGSGIAKPNSVKVDSDDDCNKTGKIMK